MTMVCHLYRCALHSFCTVPTLFLRCFAPFLHRSERCYFASWWAPPRTKGKDSGKGFGSVARGHQALPASDSNAVWQPPPPPTVLHASLLGIADQVLILQGKIKYLEHIAEEQAQDVWDRDEALEDMRNACDAAKAELLQLQHQHMHCPEECLPGTAASAVCCCCSPLCTCCH